MGLADEVPFFFVGICVQMFWGNVFCTTIFLAFLYKYFGLKKKMYIQFVFFCPKIFGEIFVQIFGDDFCANNFGSFLCDFFWVIFVRTFLGNFLLKCLVEIFGTIPWRRTPVAKKKKRTKE